MTLEFWVQQSFVDTPENFVGIINYMTLGGPDNEAGFSFIYFDGLWRFLLCATNETDIFGNGLQNWPGIELEFDQWVHVAATYDGASVKIFKNGVLIDTYGIGGGPIQWTDIDKKFDIGKGIGYGGASNNYYFEGAIDEVRVWSLARNQIEIQGTMNQVINPLPGLEAYWNFNDNQSTTVVDQTGNGYPGILTQNGSGMWFDDIFAGGEATGACCDDDGGDCEENTEGECDANGGTWQGEGTICTPNPCAVGSCFDMEITEAEFPFSHLVDLTVEDDDWDQSTFPYPVGGAHENGANGMDYTYKLILEEPAIIYVTTCDNQTDVDVQIGIYTEDCNEASWVFFQDDSNTPIFYPDGTNEQYSFECISGFESNPYYANMLPKIEWDAGTYYIVVDDRNGGNGSVKTWIGYSLLVDSTQVSGDFSSVDYFFSEGVFGGEYSEIYNGNGVGLELNDYSISINPNGGNANEANLTSINTSIGGALAGGEETVVLNLEYPNVPSGGEVLILGPASVSSIFNSVGVPLLDINGISISLVDVLAPTIQFSNPLNNASNISTVSNISIAFTETVRNSVDGANISNGNVTDCFILEEAISGENITFSIVSGDQIGFVINPDGQFPELTAIKLSILPTIEDLNNNAFQFDTLRFFTADESPPVIQSSSISSINNYVSITFNEGVYSTSNGSGALELSDISYVYNANGGHCGSATFIGVTNENGSPLVGGETTIHAILNLSASPSGVETFVLNPTVNSIFDVSGNVMSSGVESNPVTLLASAYIESYTLADSNEFVDLVFSVGVYGNAIATQSLYLSGFNVSIESNDGNATNVSTANLTSITNTTLVGGEETVRLFMNFNNLPSGVENIIISPTTSMSIFSLSGIPVPMGESSGPIILNDQNPPFGNDSMNDGELNVNEQDSLTISFNENIFLAETGEAVTVAILSSFVTLKTGDSTGTDIPFVLSIEGEPPTLTIIPVEPYPSDAVIFYSFNAVLADAESNDIEFNFSATFTIRDYIPPTVDSTALAWNNSYLDIVFDDTVFGQNDGTTSINKNDFEIEYFPNNSAADTITITSITRTDSNFLIGGESYIRVNLEYNSTPNGDEKFIVKSKVGVDIFDESGNQMFGDTMIVDTIQLFDILPPSVESISVPIDSFITLMESTPITFLFNEKIDSLNFTVSAGVRDSVNFNFIKSDSSLLLTLEPPFASHDSITIYFSYLEDEAELSTVDIAFTYVTPLLGDYNLDSTISFVDLDTLVTHWKAKNYNYELAPVTGEAPHFVSTPNSKFDIEDGMAFIRMWSWYQKNYGEIIRDTIQVGRPLDMIQKNNEILVILDKSIHAGQIQFSYKIGNLAIEFNQKQNQDEELFISTHVPEKGFSLLEFARMTEDKNDTISFMVDLKVKNLNLYYNLVNSNNSIVQKGVAKINGAVLPSKVALYPAYPNPFNPSTTIRYDIPEMNTYSSTTIDIFDLRGRKVETLVNSLLLPGSYSIKWHANQFASGMYFARLTYGGNIKIQKILLLK